MKKKMMVISSLIVLVMLALTLPGTTAADVPDACCFYGPVTVNGADVPDGTAVSARLEDPSVGPWTTTTFTHNGASWYVIYIPGGVAGDQVHFSVSSTPVPGTATWVRYGPSGILRVYHALSITYVPLTGDVNLDGCVGLGDLILVGQHFGEIGPYGGWIPEDVNVDGFVNVLDIILIFQNWTGC
jgi:hypothetical protein